MTAACSGLMRRAGILALGLALMVAAYGTLKAADAANNHFSQPNWWESTVKGKHQNVVNLEQKLKPAKDIRNHLKTKKDSALTFNTHSFKFGSLRKSTIHTVTDARFGQVYNGSVKEEEDYIYVFTGEVNSVSICLDTHT
jgi:hypothetical protein